MRPLWLVWLLPVEAQIAVPLNTVIGPLNTRAFASAFRVPSEGYIWLE